MSGTPPRDMLYTDPISPDRKDDYTKVYAVPTAIEGYDPQARAFHWGGLTAGSRWTAFWIFLAPFAFANTAGYLIEKRRKTVVFFVRLAGLALTALFAAQAVTASAVIQRWIVRQAWSAATRHWATTGLVALVVVGVIWITGVLSTQSHFAPLGIGCRLKLLFLPGDRWLSPPLVDEDRGGCGAGDTGDWSDPTAPDSNKEWAADPRLWVAHSILHRVRRIHLATGLAVIAVMIGGAGSNAALFWSGTAVLVVAVILLAITTSVPERPWARIATSWLTIPGVLAAAGSIAALWVSSPFPEWSDIHDVNLMISVAFGVGSIGALLSGAGKAVGALAIAAFFGSAMGIAAASVLERVTGEGSSSSSVISNGAGWVAVWMLVMVLILVSVASGLSLWPLAVEPDKSLIPEDGPPLSSARLRELRKRQGERRVLVAIRRITNRIRYLLWASVGVGLAATVGLGLFLCDAGTCSPGNLTIDDWGLVQWLVWIALALVTIALAVHKGWLAVVIPAAAGLVLAVDSAFLKLEILQVEIDFTSLVDTSLAIAVLIPALFFLRSVTAGIGSGESRRKTGLLWDVVSFWPRHFHPLGPPAYGPNAVQELRRELGKTPDVTLSAHSQGSMIATVALTQMNSGEAAKIRQVVTYGSPLGLIYEDVFSPVGFRRILEHKAGHEGLKWANLWRTSDYLGGLPIPVPGNNNHLADDIGHSQYECTRQYGDVIAGIPVTSLSDESRRCRAPLPD